MYTALLTQIRAGLKSSGVYVLVGFLPLSFALLFTPLYTQYLTPAQYGLLSLFNILGGVLGLTFNLGVTTAYGTLYWEHRRDGLDHLYLLRLTLTLMAVLAICLSGLIGLAGWCCLDRVLESAREFSFWPYFVSAMVFGCANSFSQIFLYQYRNEQRVGRFAAVNLLQFGLMSAGTLLAVVWLRLGAEGAVFARTTGMSLVGVALVGLVLLRHGPAWDWGLAARLLRVGIPFFGYLMIGSVVTYLDRGLIEQTFTLREFGLYGFAATVASVLDVLFTALQNTAVPGIQRDLVFDAQAHAASVRSRSLRVFVVVVVAAALFLPAAWLGVRWLIHPSYHAALWFLPALLLASVFRSASGVYSIAYYAFRQTAAMLWVQVANLVITLLTAWLVLPLLGLAGVLVVIVMSRALDWVFMALMLRRITTFRYGDRDYAILLLAFAAAVLVGYTLNVKTTWGLVANLLIPATAIICYVLANPRLRGLLLGLTPTTHS